MVIAVHSPGLPAAGRAHVSPAGGVRARGVGQGRRPGRHAPVTDQALRLIDSIGRGWPIGTLIVYGPYPEEGLVLDGRHRLTTIADSLHAPLAGDPRPDSGSEMYWDLTDTTGQATRHSPTIDGRPSSWWLVRTLTSTLALLTHGRTSPPTTSTSSSRLSTSAAWLWTRGCRSFTCRPEGRQTR
ncbi:hypothetical protein Lfu02_00150 [Longispora fulva]|nr:hypothetical protein Lfu02_00150 [Longispora fulva]